VCVTLARLGRVHEPPPLTCRVADFPRPRLALASGRITFGRPGAGTKIR
jgi:hypothetical protein